MTFFASTIMIFVVVKVYREELVERKSEVYMIGGYVTVNDIAQRWGLTRRTVQFLCSEGKIKGATRFGKAWAIPDDAEKPTDNRLRTGKYVGWRKCEKKDSNQDQN